MKPTKRVVQFYSKSADRDDLNGITDWRKKLSNFWPSEIIYKGEIYPSVEHAFAAAKYTFAQGGDIPDLRELSGGDLKRAHGRRGMKSRGFVLDMHAWDAAKVSIMWSLLVQRLTHDKEFRTILESLSNTYILHFERSGPRSFWGGVYRNEVIEGQNVLGKMMMELSGMAIASSVLISLT